MRAGLALLTIATLSACGGGAPAGPTPTPSPLPTTPQPTTFTISGNLTATNGGQPLTATMNFGAAATTATNGQFSVSVPANAFTLSLSISGAGLIPRRAYVAPGTRTVNLDAIAEQGFDATFYREFVRNTYDAPTTMEPLRRWTRTPSIYLNTVDDSGAAVNEATLLSTEQALREAMPVWSAGQFAASIVRGTESRIGQAGWITVTWSTDRPANRCGQSDVGREGGEIRLFPLNGCKCGSNVVTMYPRLIKHELGHAMGFWHTDNVGDVMFAGEFPRGLDVCDTAISARERYHAAIAYRRPVGNTDPDQDPSGAVNLAPLRVR